MMPCAGSASVTLDPILPDGPARKQRDAAPNKTKKRKNISMIADINEVAANPGCLSGMPVPVVLNGHKVNPLNDALGIAAVDSRGPGGAHHLYLVYAPVPINGGGVMCHPIRFQCGPIPQAGINGVTHEALLTIVEHRLECFQEGGYSCEENAAALAHVRAAREALLERTRKRMARNVEGTMAV
jgi:hypothetical protein